MLSDTKEVVQAINGAYDLTINSTIQYIISQASFEYVSFVFVLRSLNEVAPLLAKLSYSLNGMGSCELWYGVLYSCLLFVCCFLLWFVVPMLCFNEFSFLPKKRGAMAVNCKNF